MLGRKVGSSLPRLPLYARLPLRPSPFQCQSDVVPRSAIVLSTRSYASPGRPRKTVGEPSKPVKRAVKRTAKANDGPAKKQVEAKKKTAAAKKKKTTPKKRAPKELTAEQKEAKQARLDKAKIAELKKAALKPPTRRSVTAYNAFFSEKMKGIDGKLIGGPDRAAKMRDVMRPLVEEYRSLSPAELEHYNHLAHSKTEAINADYKRWVESHTPEQIQFANLARNNLRRRLGDAVFQTQKYGLIHDERHVKRPASSFAQFNVNRQASGDFKNIAFTERMKLIAQEWKALSESEKKVMKKYKDLGSQEKTRYASEYNDVYGHLPPGAHSPATATAAA
ncbi:uncharacterized protein LTR77_006812 [Saxophila tyrrhenica]|uniref:HMG box domain-containing protein n=1 Tax=Saxophila tyrrhenica TaxID=1690608 RepID=A0AAV9P6D5_9PEZI|nr:hypothetical protein LTR77_006812 [Saxophila tyrrhenica]